jgi:hypothetical protein
MVLLCNICDDAVVFTPFVQKLSLIAIGIPSNIPRDVPVTQRTTPSYAICHWQNS